MPEGKDFQKQLAAIDPRLTGISDKTPLKVSVTLAFEPNLLESIAAESRRLGCSFEDVLVAAVREKFASKADEEDEIFR